mmetsp:Transcript_62/g.73  ORF Transcript_62/g.73 Transcript_62/m.73 type:complete len:330 (-) Transcript_62:32-1021(-)
MELSHRSKYFEEIIQSAESKLRQLLNIPSNYKVLFMQGGGCGQFASVPLNLLGNKTVTDYVVTGTWSQKASEEARKYCDVNIVCNTESTKYTTLPDQSQWSKFSDNAAYLYYCANETVHGVEFHHTPSLNSQIPLVCDMSSNFLSRPVDVSKYGLIFAGAQKNSGIAGVTIAIVRDDLLGLAREDTPVVMHYKTTADSGSMYNTPPTYSIYIANLVYQWLQDQGGLEAIEKYNIQKSAKIYDVINSSNGFYRCPVSPACQSRMNIPVKLADEKLEAQFLKQAAERGLVDLAGHRSVGGVRVSVYNAMPMEGVDKLTQFMEEFQQNNTKS